METYYSILEVPINESIETIDQIHRGFLNRTQELTIKQKEAFEVLLNTDPMKHTPTKEFYDKFLQTVRITKFGESLKYQINDAIDDMFRRTFKFRGNVHTPSVEPPMEELGCQHPVIIPPPKIKGGYIFSKKIKVNRTVKPEYVIYETEKIWNNMIIPCQKLEKIVDIDPRWIIKEYVIYFMNENGKDTIFGLFHDNMHVHSYLSRDMKHEIEDKEYLKHLDLPSSKQCLGRYTVDELEFNRTSLRLLEAQMKLFYMPTTKHHYDISPLKIYNCNFIKTESTDNIAPQLVKHPMADQLWYEYDKERFV